MPSKREKIEAMLVEEPGDTFLRYSLAFELDKEEDYDGALALFAGLTKDDPPYVPAFFMGGQLLAKIGRVEESRALLRDGIEEARKQGDSHAAGEMAEFLSALGSF